MILKIQNFYILHQRNRFNCKVCFWQSTWFCL